MKIKLTDIAQEVKIEKSDGTIIDLLNVVDKDEFENLIINLEGGGYGVKIVNKGTISRIGNENLHKTLPIQSKMRRCLLKNGSVYGYIDPNDYTKYMDGTTVDYSGTDGDVMVEVPEYYYNAYTYVDENENTVDILMLYPYSIKQKKSKKTYIGAFEAASDGTTLASICTTNFTVSNGTVDMTQLTYTSNAATWRGGNKSATHDADVKSLLGRPLTSQTRATFRTRAAAKGAGYSQEYWDAYMAVVRLYVVEYCNLNSQDTYSSSNTADGYKQGGLGAGFSNINSTEWNNFTGYYPLCPCGITKSLVNNTGIINITYPAGTINETTARTFSIPSYRGIENPFGHIWKWCDGMNINTVNGVTTIYTTDDITKFADNTSTNYVERVSFNRSFTEGWIKSWSWGENGDFIPTQVGASSSTGLCDYSWWNNTNVGWRVLGLGGDADSGSYCGWFCFAAGADSVGVTASIGGRLNYTPSN